MIIIVGGIIMNEQFIRSRLSDYEKKNRSPRAKDELGFRTQYQLYSVVSPLAERFRQ